MKTEQQTIQVIDRAQIREQAARFLERRSRLVQVCATALTETFEITYTFAGDHAGLESLRVLVPRTDPVLPSITGSYPCAFSYENEMQDLFGIRVDGLALDFKGRFYIKAAPAPFAACPVKEDKPHV
jgi:ech hydrogenase subunit D